MKKNMSKIDGYIRLIVALAIIGLWYFGIVGSVLLIILAIVAGTLRIRTRKA